MTSPLGWERDLPLHLVWCHRSSISIPHNLPACDSARHRNASDKLCVLLTHRLSPQSTSDFCLLFIRTLPHIRFLPSSILPVLLSSCSLLLLILPRLLGWFFSSPCAFRVDISAYLKHRVPYFFPFSAASVRFFAQRLEDLGPSELLPVWLLLGILVWESSDGRRAQKTWAAHGSGRRAGRRIRKDGRRI